MTYYIGVALSGCGFKCGKESVSGNQSSSKWAWLEKHIAEYGHGVADGL